MAPKAPFLPFQRRCRSVSSRADLTSRAPLCSQIALDQFHGTFGLLAQAFDFDQQHRFGIAGKAYGAPDSTASMVVRSIISNAAGMIPAPVISTTARVASSIRS